MARLRPDPTFYASPSLAAEAPPEDLAYVALLAAGGNGQRDALGVVDTNPASPTYGRLVGQAGLPARRERAAPLRLERVQLAPLPLRAERARRAPLPGRSGHALSSRIHILDTKPDPRQPGARQGDRRRRR